MDSPLGLASQRCLAALVFAAGSAIAPERSHLALACARALLEASELRLKAGATSPHQQVNVLRVLSPLSEPAMQLLRQVWVAGRREMWGLLGGCATAVEPVKGVTSFEFAFHLAHNLIKNPSI